MNAIGLVEYAINCQEAESITVMRYKIIRQEEEYSKLTKPFPRSWLSGLLAPILNVSCGLNT